MNKAQLVITRLVSVASALEAIRISFEKEIQKCEGLPGDTSKYKAAYMEPLEGFCEDLRCYFMQCKRRADEGVVNQTTLFDGLDLFKELADDVIEGTDYDDEWNEQWHALETALEDLCMIDLDLQDLQKEQN